MIGTQISHYIIVEKLGDGGMGTVYRAKDIRLLRHVAIKLLRPELMVDKKKRLRFIKEAQTASSLNHPNICTIHDINEDNDQHFIVMELVEGKTLREILEDRKMLPESELIEIAVKICQALSAVHEKGISHRDIKPENIMIANSGLVKVMDFGLAKLATEYVESVAEMDGNQSWRKEYLDNVVTNLSGLLGTVHYMSPEQAQGEDVDPRSDIFSLGIMLYELLTGEKPFIGKTNLDVLTKIIKETSEIDSQSGIVSPEFKSIISRALEKNADDRYQNINELLQDLIQLKTDKFASSNGSVKNEISGSKRTTLFVSILAIVIVVVLVVYLSNNYRQKDTEHLMHTTRFTSYPGAELYPAFSPDGNSVAFSWNGPDQNNMDIYIKRKEGGNPVRLTTNPSADWNPEWSGDGRIIAFTRPFPDIPRTYDIFIIPSTGGQEQKVGRISPMGNIPNLSWSKDNKFIFFSQWAPKDTSVAVFKVSLETQNVEQVTSPPAEVLGDLSPRVSPDGKYIGFIRKKMSDSVDIYIQKFDNGEIQRVVSENAEIKSFSWGKNSRSIIYTANLDGTSALWKTDISGKRKEKILSGISVNNPDYSPSGNSIVYNEYAANSNIWKMDLQNPDKEVLLISSSTMENLNPDISPDGARIVFSSDRTGTHNIWMCNSDGTEQTQLTFFDNQIKPGNAYWSSLNNKILISFRSDDYVLDLPDGQLKELGDIGIYPIWAQNGRDYYVSVYPGTNLYFLSEDGKNKKQITRKMGLYAKLSGDYLYYFKHYDQRVIWRVKTDGTQEEPILQNIEGLGISTWDVTSNGIYFYRWNNGSKTLFFLDLKTREIKEIRNIPGAVGSIEVDPDGQYLLYSKSEAGWSDLILVENIEIK